MNPHTLTLEEDAVSAIESRLGSNEMIKMNLSELLYSTHNESIRNDLYNAKSSLFGLAKRAKDWAIATNTVIAESAHGNAYFKLTKRGRILTDSLRLADHMNSNCRSAIELITLVRVDLLP